jgi:hypothetical protein
MAAKPDTFSAKRAACLLGVARIDLKRLEFKVALRKNHRAESLKSKRRLLEVFELEGCRRLEEENFVEALITNDTLENALHRSGLSEGSFKVNSLAAIQGVGSIPKLDLDCAIQCLNGMHRVSAAKQYLDNNDQWWVVKLYKEESRFHLHLAMFIKLTSGQRL